MSSHDRHLSWDEADILKSQYPSKRQVKKWLKKCINREDRRTWRKRYEEEVRSDVGEG